MHPLTLWQYSLDDPVGELHQIHFQSQNNKLDETTNLLPGGVYTTFRTYHKSYSLPLIDHIERLEHSAAANGRAVTLDREIFRRNLRLVLNQHPAEEKRIRVTLVHLTSSSLQIYFAVEPLQTPSPELYQTGVKVLTTRLERENPDVKQTEFILQTKSLRSMLTDGINEILLVNQMGIIREGLSSNFFAVRADALITDEEGILPGITRKIVLNIAEKLNVPVVFSGISVDELELISEAFITSASRGVMPVVKIDQTKIGVGKPGNITRKIIGEFNRFIETIIEPI